MQTSSQRKRVLDGSQSDITEMKDNVIRPDRRIPPADQLSIHLLDTVERAAGKLTDPGATEVGTRRDEIDLVEVERRIAGRFGHR